MKNRWTAFKRDPAAVPDGTPSAASPPRWLIGLKLAAMGMASTLILFAAPGGSNHPVLSSPPRGPALTNAKAAALSTKAPEPILVKIAHPKRGELTRGIVLPGVVRAYQQATLYAKVGGYLKSIAVDQGDRISAGQLLADIEVPELLADQAKYQAEVTMTESDYHRLDTAHQQSPDLVVQQLVDKARGIYEMARANLNRTETLLRYAKITAPFPGVITQRFVDRGAFIPAATTGSSSQSAALVTIADFTQVRIRVSVPEPEVPQITNGLPVRITVDELPDEVFLGTVTRYARALDEVTKTMPLEVDLPNPNELLRPGMYAKVEILLERKADALKVPASAVFNDGPTTTVLAVVDNKTKKVPVTVGFRDGTVAEILEGLTTEDVVVVGRNHTSEAGLAVRVQELQ